MAEHLAGRNRHTLPSAAEVHQHWLAAEIESQTTNQQRCYLTWCFFFYYYFLSSIQECIRLKHFTAYKSCICVYLLVQNSSMAPPPAHTFIIHHERSWAIDHRGTWIPWYNMLFRMFLSPLLRNFFIFSVLTGSCKPISRCIYMFSVNAAVVKSTKAIWFVFYLSSLISLSADNHWCKWSIIGLII